MIKTGVFFKVIRSELIVFSDIISKVNAMICFTIGGVDEDELFLRVFAADRRWDVAMIGEFHGEVRCVGDWDTIMTSVVVLASDFHTRVQGISDREMSVGLTPQGLAVISPSFSATMGTALTYQLPNHPDPSFLPKAKFRISLTHQQRGRARDKIKSVLGNQIVCGTLMVLKIFCVRNGDEVHERVFVNDVTSSASSAIDCTLIWDDDSPEYFEAKLTVPWVMKLLAPGSNIPVDVCLYGDMECNTEEDDPVLRPSPITFHYSATNMDVLFQMAEGPNRARPEVYISRRQSKQAKELRKEITSVISNAIEHSSTNMQLEATNVPRIQYTKRKQDDDDLD